MSRLWYALHVRSRFEEIVEAELTKRRYETFLPMHTGFLFPRYVFSRFDRQSSAAILTIPGVKCIAGLTKSSLAIDENEISALRRIIECGFAVHVWPYATSGEKVCVASGPLEGINGILVTDKGCDRLIVSISVTHRSVSVEIDRDCTKPQLKKTETT